MDNLSLIDDINKVKNRLTTYEEMLGKGLLQPFNNANSGSRKIMFGTQIEHVLPLFNPELPIISTGYENRFGDYSASILENQEGFKIIAKINKFSFMPGHHYYLIIQKDNGELDIIERVSYHHITESYGYLMNNQKLDSLSVGGNIPPKQILTKSMAYDEYMNRMDGVNLLTSYISCDESMEDGIIVSEDAAKKLSSPLIRKASMMINENVIPLNLYGNDDIYKIIPDIGEEVKNGILCSLRIEKKQESLFSQSWERLKHISMSDEKYTVSGKVIDINIYCNNKENLTNSPYSSQLLMYYNENIRFATEVINVVDQMKGCRCSYDLQKLVSNCRRSINEDQYTKDKENRPFSNIIMDVYLLETNTLQVGDKLSNRFGGKGVVSEIRPNNMMPVDERTGEHVQLIFNSSTCVNRENPGQLFETSLTHIGSQVVDFVDSNVLHMDEVIEMVLKYISLSSPEQSEYIKDQISKMQDDEVIQYIGSMINSGNIDLSIKPISESMDLERLKKIYDEFSWVSQCKVIVPLKDSNGNIRYVPARRRITLGREYIFRLKQYAEEKFSVTSLAATNIRNENSRNKANKNYKALHTKTPIQFGEMESGDFVHLGMVYVVTNLMIHSVSPHARRLTEQMMTGDPFNIDIKLDKDCKNRKVEILNAYLKTMGLRLVFKKVYKNLKQPITVSPISMYGYGPESPNPIRFVDKNDKGFPITEYKSNCPITFYPIKFLTKSVARKKQNK